MSPPALSPRVSARKRQGRCYELAFRGQMAAPNWQLIHGAVKMQGTVYGVYGHAWLELGDQVYDPVLDTYLPQADYYCGQRARPICRYSATEAARLALEHGTYGAWNSEVPA